MTDEKALKLSEQQKDDIVKGAKADIAGWCLYITLIWCLKACMLFFYRRLTWVPRKCVDCIEKACGTRKTNTI